MTNVVALMIDKMISVSNKKNNTETKDRSEVSFSEVKRNVTKNNDRKRENDDKVKESRNDDPVEKEREYSHDEVKNNDDDSKTTKDIKEKDKSKDTAQSDNTAQTAAAVVTSIVNSGEKIVDAVETVVQEALQTIKAGTSQAANETASTNGTESISGKINLTVNKHDENSDITNATNATNGEGQRTANTPVLIGQPYQTTAVNATDSVTNTAQPADNNATSVVSDQMKALDSKDVLNLDIVKSGKLGDLVMASKTTATTPTAEKITNLLENGKLFAESINAVKGIKAEITAPVTAEMPAAVSNLANGALSAIVTAVETIAKPEISGNIDHFRISFDSEMESFVRDLSRKFENFTSTTEDMLSQTQNLAAQTTGQTIAQIDNAIESFDVPRTKFTEVLTSKITERFADKSEGQSSMKVTITPPNLGEVKVDLSMKDGILNADFQCSGDTVKVINDSLSSLQKSLSDCGIQLGNSTVSSGWQQSSGNEQQSSHNYRHSDNIQGPDDSGSIEVNTSAGSSDSRELNMLV